MNEKKVDVLLLCVASFSQVKNYPEGIVNFIQPKYIIGNHWENFFKPQQKLLKKPAVVPGTNAKKFIKRLEQTIATDSIEFKLPQPHTSFEFSY